MCCSLPRETRLLDRFSLAHLATWLSFSCTSSPSLLRFAFRFYLRFGNDPPRSRCKIPPRLWISNIMIAIIVPEHLRSKLLGPYARRKSSLASPSTWATKFNTVGLEGGADPGKRGECPEHLNSPLFRVQSLEEVVNQAEKYLGLPLVGRMCPCWRTVARRVELTVPRLILKSGTSPPSCTIVQLGMSSVSKPLVTVYVEAT